MLVNELETTLTLEEIEFARKQLGREPNALEWSMIDAEWSEHCSYKSSRPILAQLPTTSPYVLLGPGYDSGVVDIGDGYVLTFHIESHNHPSAIDPYGGAATGIGGVVRDILCMGTTPIAFMDALKFGDITKSDHSKWIMKNVVRGIADYGNCIGVPTVAGEIEFDECFERNCLVDVACLGVGRKDKLLLAEATHPGDSVFLIGSSTGRDGIYGATFASRTLAADTGKERSAVQIPDPFMKKLIIEATLEANEARVVRGCKDLGGGGLITGISEIADKGASGIEVYLEKIPIREPDMNPIEIMISESQERMLLVVKRGHESPLERIMWKLQVPFARIGEVNSTKTITVTHFGESLAQLPTTFVANAPIVQRKVSVAPLDSATREFDPPKDLGKILLNLLRSPTIASKQWVFSQFDHEVGIRTIVKPGQADAAVLSLPNGKLTAIKVDGNASYADLDPYLGGASVLAESCRNLVSVGARPIAMLDHCQFGDPNDAEIFWAFSMAVKGIADFAKTLQLPCIGGKVSFYNQDGVTGKAIKASPVIAILGVIEKPEHVTRIAFKEGDTVVAVGRTKLDLGGSEYYRLLSLTGSTPPALDFNREKSTLNVVLECIEKGYVTACHDCSKGGLAVALAEMSISGAIGASLDLRSVPADRMRDDELLFSESNSRFMMTTDKPQQLLSHLAEHGIPALAIGTVEGSSLHFILHKHELRCDLTAMQGAYVNSLEKILEP